MAPRHRRQVVGGVQRLRAGDRLLPAVRRGGQPALDTACGTGRLLLPYLRAGLDVDGCDISPDMLALCRSRQNGKGCRRNCTRRPCTSSTCRVATGRSSSAAGSASGAPVSRIERRFSGCTSTSSPAGRWLSTTRSPTRTATGATGRMSRGRDLPQPWPASGDRRSRLRWSRIRAANPARRPRPALQRDHGSRCAPRFA